MSLFQNIIVIMLLISAAGFLSLTEIALRAREGEAEDFSGIGRNPCPKVLDLQQQSADFFAASQIGLKCDCHFRRYFR